MAKNTYKSDVKIGERYRDEQTGMEGTVTGVFFYQHGCERVNLETVKDGTVTDYGLDAPRLTSIATGKRVKVRRTGGPRPGGERPDVPRR